MHPTRPVEKPIPVEIGRAGLHDVQITWNDGHTSRYPARQLRLLCPCASCVSEGTGEKILDPRTIPDDVHPLKISPVGRYAIQISWSDHHSTGIFSFDYLRDCCPCEVCRSADMS